jgi:protein-arginine kinase activator protein McsA
MFVCWQASPETSASLNGSQNLVYETEHLRTQLNDSLKEIHQKELRIQQLNSKVCASCWTGIQFLFSMTGSKKVSK